MQHGKVKVSYTTPNFNGFQATIGIVNPNTDALGNGSVGAGGAAAANTMFADRFGVEGAAQYEWTGDLSGKVWASFASHMMLTTGILFQQRTTR
jgi:hypothetical protein